MEIESLDQGVVEKEPINVPVHICFTRIEYERWKVIRSRLNEIKPNAKIQEFGRIALRDLMNRLEHLLDKQEAKS